MPFSMALCLFSVLITSKGLSLYLEAPFNIGNSKR